MAVIITRTPWIDDDGTGTTGTVINNAWKTELYNQIDGALAKVAQLAGGNTFTGAQAIAGNLTVGAKFIVTQAGSMLVNTAAALANGIVSVGADGTVAPALVFQNTSAGNFINFQLFLNSAGGTAGAIQQNSATTIAFLTTSDRRLKIDHGRATDVAALRALVVHDFAREADGLREYGVFAQEAYAHVPDAVVPGDDSTGGERRRPWMIDYSKLVGRVIAGWQQHDTEIAELRAALAAAKG